LAAYAQRLKQIAEEQPFEVGPYSIEDDVPAGPLGRPAVSIIATTKPVGATSTRPACDIYDPHLQYGVPLRSGDA
jgi:hypothetical protein